MPLPPPPDIRCAVVMGVAGCGKSTVGAALAKSVVAAYLDGDDLHPPQNIAKMTLGQPLTDADRLPWLERVGQTLREHPGRTFIGCSALRRSYRDLIRDAAQEPVAFLHLAGDRKVIEARMSRRKGHFMPVSLLDSQFATLEPLEPDEIGVVADIDQSFATLLDDLAFRLRTG